MKYSVRALLATAAALTVTAPAVRLASASADSGQAGTEIIGPIDATACDATPPTIALLGLTIDVSSADFGGAICAALTAGQVVEVKLASPDTPLTATGVILTGSDDGIGDNGTGEDSGTDG